MRPWSCSNPQPPEVAEGGAARGGAAAEASRAGWESADFEGRLIIEKMDDDDWMLSPEAEAAMCAAEATLVPQGQAAPGPCCEAPPAVESAALLRVLREVWGYEGFREGQEAAVRAVVAGRDCAVYWATGSGKSLVYQVPALLDGPLWGGVVLVVSPLVSLMMDQVKTLNLTCGRDVACFLGSAQEDRSVEARALRGGYKLVYATPEKAVGSRAGND